jgi:hypothetical protein
MDSAGAGWYKDPEGSEKLRFFDGKAWTAQLKLPGEAAASNIGQPGIEKYLGIAIGRAAEGDIPGEHDAVFTALKLASSSGSGLPGLTRTKLWQMRQEGKILRGSNFYGLADRLRVLTGKETEKLGMYFHGKNFLGPLMEMGGGALEVRSDRVIQGPVAHPIDGNTRAQVFLEGSQQVTYRPTAARTLLLAPLPGSAAVGALATQKKESHDTREASLQISSASWVIMTRIRPDDVMRARSFAEQVNRVAESVEKNRTASNDAASAQPLSVADEIAKLQLLLGAGALTEGEYEKLKARLIDG